MALISACSEARAQFFQPQGAGTENIEGFTVVGKGYVSAKPNLFEIELEVSAASELTADAIVKFRDAKKRIRDAFSALKLANVAVEERGLLMDQKGMMDTPYYFRGMANSRTKTEVQLSRKLIVTGSDIRKLDEEGVMQLSGKLLDVAQDAGAKVGPQNPGYYYYYYDFPPRNTNGLVRFVLDDLDKLQEQAYEKAIADARARAERLARLSRVELGPIVAIRELTVPGERAASDDEAPRKRMEVSKFQEIPVRVELLVRFEVSPKPEAKRTQSP
jgi:uncharacterized protein YggE